MKIRIPYKKYVNTIEPSSENYYIKVAAFMKSYAYFMSSKLFHELNSFFIIDKRDTYFRFNEELKEHKINYNRFKNVIVAFMKLAHEKYDSNKKRKDSINNFFLGKKEREYVIHFLDKDLEIDIEDENF